MEQPFLFPHGAAFFMVCRAGQKTGIYRLVTVSQILYYQGIHSAISLTQKSFTG